MRTLHSLVVLLGMVSGLFAAPQVYEITPGPDGRFALEVFKTGLMSGKKHLFLFEKVGGTLRYDRNDPEAGKVVLTIETDSIVLRDDWIDADDRQKVLKAAREDMLAVEKYPQMQFVSQSVRRTGEGRFAVEGLLTIRGIAKPVVVDVNLSAAGDVLRFSGSAEVKLKDYGLKPPSTFLGIIGTKNEMKVSFTLQGRPAASEE